MIPRQPPTSTIRPSSSSSLKLILILAVLTLLTFIATSFYLHNSLHLHLTGQNGVEGFPVKHRPPPPTRPAKANSEPFDPHASPLPARRFPFNFAQNSNHQWPSEPMMMDTWVGETLAADEQTKMTVQVPTFLPDLPTYNAQPFLGITHIPNPKDELAPLLPTIFISIASYRDPMCPQTVTDILSRATHPSRLRFGIVQQNDLTDVPCNVPPTPCATEPSQPMCIHSSQIDLFNVPADVATGPVTARAIGSRLYGGEKYAMQIDAHLGFVKGWDEEIVGQLEGTGNAKAVLTTYLTDIQHSIGPSGQSLRKTTPIMCNSAFEKTHQGSYMRHNSQPEVIPPITTMPTLSPYFAAGFVFSAGQFVRDVPYDPYLAMVFMGEEISVGVRGFTHGYDFYTPLRSVCFHYYAIGENAAVRKKVKHFWEHSGAHEGSGRRSMERLLGVIGMQNTAAFDEREAHMLERYGLGNVRAAHAFYDLFGIDVERKKSADATQICQFVKSGEMHREFMQYLRPVEEGMWLAEGIDYEGIGGDYRIPGLDYSKMK